MSDSQLSLLEGVLESLSSPISEQDILTLGAILGHDQLKDALDLIDRDQVARIHLPNGNYLYQCKHLLACRIADKIADERGWKDKFVTAKWVAGWAVGFGMAVPDQLKVSTAGGTAK
ncbi:hypothetical protein JCM16303_006902 [Sporobolomyces ruberrimus]